MSKNPYPKCQLVSRISRLSSLYVRGNATKRRKLTPTAAIPAATTPTTVVVVPVLRDGKQVAAICSCE